VPGPGADPQVDSDKSVTVGRDEGEDLAVEAPVAVQDPEPAVL
jgi:hypothetical protein